MGQRSSIFILLGSLTVELKMKPVLNIWADTRHGTERRALNGLLQWYYKEIYSVIYLQI